MKRRIKYKRYLIIHLLLITACKSLDVKTNTREELKILFIGNSLTYYNDMPKILKKMLVEKGYNSFVKQYTQPGVQLWMNFKTILPSESNLDNNLAKLTLAERLVLKEDWDFIIVQGGTVPMLIPGAKEEKLDRAFLSIKSLAKSKNVYIFETWPSLKSYPKKYCYATNTSDPKKDCSVEIENLEQEVFEIKKNYLEVGNKYSFNVVDVCDKFYTVLKNHKEISLYEDEIHPNEYGAFLNACIFYSLITGEKASSIRHNGNIEKRKAKILKRVADL